MRSFLVTEKFYIVVYFLLVFSLLVGIDSMPFRGEESRRFIMSMEMLFSGDFFNPTVLGEAYFNKPPFFGLVVAIFFEIFGYGEFALRLVTVFSSILSSLIAAYISFIHTQNIRISIFTSIVFLSFLDVLFWYGFLGEIDMLFTSLLNISLISFFTSVLRKNILLAVLSGIFAGVAFLTKGFPVFVFSGTFFITLIIFHKNLLQRLLLMSIISIISFFVIILFWVLNTENIQLYFERLYQESFSRVGGSSDLLSWIVSKLEFVLIVLKMTAPLSLILLFLLIKQKFKIDYQFHDFRVFYTWILLTFVLFWLFTSSAGRYILPLFPAFASVLSILIFKNRERWIKKLIYLFIGLAFLRVILGVIYPHLYFNRNGNLKEYALEIKHIVKESKLSCDCHEKYEVCAYLDMVYQKPIYSSAVTKNPVYMVYCKNQPNLELVKSFKIGKDEFFLYKN